MTYSPIGDDLIPELLQLKQEGKTLKDIVEHLYNKHNINTSVSAVSKKLGAHAEHQRSQTVTQIKQAAAKATATTNIEILHKKIQQLDSWSDNLVGDKTQDYKNVADILIKCIKLEADIAGTGPTDAEPEDYTSLINEMKKLPIGPGAN
jgi:hypothetical protein